MRYNLVLIMLLLLASPGQAQKILVIHFDSDSATLRATDRTSLDSLISAHDEFPPAVSLLLAGHTDNSGRTAHNDSLSLRRAQSVRDYLRSKGWPDSLFRAVNGFGSSQPLNDNSDPGKRSGNRRVEMTILPLPSSPRPPAATATAYPDTVRATYSPDPDLSIHYSRPPSLEEIFRDTSNLVGKNIVLRNVNFYGDRHIPLPGSDIVLQQLAVIMHEFPGLHIEIQGYVCCMADNLDGPDIDAHTPDLSVQRAKYVYNFLAGQGIKKNRMTYKGFGASHKIYPEERDEAQRTANRRVEIKLVSF